MLISNIINISNASSYYNGEEKNIPHTLVLDLSTGKCEKNIKEDDLVYNYTVLKIEKDGEEKEFTVEANSYIDEESLTEIREFCKYEDSIEN